MATKTLHRAEIIFPSMDTDLIKNWSRQINKKDRLIYKVDEGVVTVYIVSALGHYDDK